MVMKDKPTSTFIVFFDDKCPYYWKRLYVIVPHIPRENARRYFSHHSKIFFPVRSSFSVERSEKLGLVTFK